MNLSAFLVSSNLSSNLHIPLYYLTAPFPYAGDLDPPISPLPWVLGVLCLFLLLYQLLPVPAVVDCVNISSSSLFLQ